MENKRKMMWWVRVATPILYSCRVSSLTFLVILILVLPLKLHKHEHGRNDLPSQDPDLAPARILILYETVSPNFWWNYSLYYVCAPPSGQWERFFYRKYLVIWSFNRWIFYSCQQWFFAKNLQHWYLLLCRIHILLNLKL